MKAFVPRSVAGLALATVLVILSPSAVYASDRHGQSDTTTTTIDSTPTIDPTPTIDSTAPTNALKIWDEEMVSYHAARLAINKAFKRAVFSTQAVYHSARLRANTAAARSTARAAYILALTQAVAERDSELTILGRPPSVGRAHNGGKRPSS